AARGRPPGGALWHRAANLVVLCYLAATAVLMPLHAAGVVQRWTVVHVLLLGAVTNAVVTWTAHSSTAMLHAPGPGPRFSALRLIGLNVGVLGILTGIGHGLPAVTAGSGLVLAAVIVAHLVSLVRMRRQGLGGRFVATVRFYWAGTLALIAGMTAGVVMGVGLAGSWHSRVYAAHLSLNLLGWVGLAVLGTLFLLWPTVLGTRMAEGAMRAARRALPPCAPGRAGTAVGLAPAVGAWRRRGPERPAAFMLAASIGWLLIALGVAIAGALTAAGPEALAGRLSAMLPWFLAGFVAQVLIGSLTHFLPLVLGGGPAGGGAAGRLLDRFGRTRVVAA